jgi:hypothetical protein
MNRRKKTKDELKKDITKKFHSLFEIKKHYGLLVCRNVNCSNFGKNWNTDYSNICPFCGTTQNYHRYVMLIMGKDLTKYLNKISNKYFGKDFMKAKTKKRRKK